VSGTAWIEAQAVAALVALLVLPGALLVRAPWSLTPFLSLAFWCVSAWWVPDGRTRFLQAVLAATAVLLLLRLREARRPARPGLAGALLALACAMPFALHLSRPVASAPDGPEVARSALLQVWHDGLPRTEAPVGRRPCGAARAALPSLAADVALLSGVAPHRAASLLGAAAAALLALATFRLAATRMPALAALVASVACLVAGWFLEGAVALAAALAVAAAVCAVPPTLPRALAAGLLLGAALQADAATTVALAVASVAIVRPSRRALGAATAVALVTTAPWIWHVAQTPAGLLRRPSLLDVLCAEAGPRGRWMEAIAGRRVADPETPGCVPLDAEGRITSFHTQSWNHSVPNP
jgi:hypothetical protein